MRKGNSDFRSDFISGAGSLAENMDYFAFAELDDMACWVMADGLDSDKEAKSAEMVVKNILGNFMEKPSMSRGRIKKYIREAHRLLINESSRVRLKASIVLVVTDYTRIIWAVAGNARLYHFRNGKLNFKSKDQSLAQQMVDTALIPEDKLEQHEERHNLLNYLGKPEDLTPFVSKKYKLNDGDVMLLCTPGLWEDVNNAEMLDAVEGAQEPSELVDTLEDVLLSKQKKVLHNYSIATVFVNKTYIEDTKKRMKLIKIIALIVLIILIIGIVLYIHKVQTDAKKAELTASMQKQEKSGDQSMKDEDYQKALTDYGAAEATSTQLKDTAMEKELGNKERLAQLIVDGDNSFKTGDYNKAQKSYENARKEAINQPDFDISNLNNKIAQNQSFMKVLELTKQGDLKKQGEDYAGAKDAYQQAMNLSIEVSFDKAQKDLKGKLDEVEAKMTAAEKQKSKAETELVEKKGDESFAAQEYEKAIAYYSLAQDMCQSEGLPEKILGLENKIIQAQTKLNPGSQSPSASQGASTAPSTNSNGGPSSN